MAAVDDAPRLDRTTLLHGIYRSLLNNGRTYAAFEDGQLEPLLDRLRDRGEILDPMSGYGTLTRCCAHSKHPIRSYCLEANEPAYLWQVLTHPKLSRFWIDFANGLLARKSKWPRNRHRATVGDDWFPPESQRILLELWENSLRDIDQRSFGRGQDPEYLALAFLLPFCARFAAMTEGNVVTHVAKGGMCVYRGWRTDFEKYIRRLLANLEKQVRMSRRVTHTVVLGDCLKITWPSKRFSAMITSPPYPNTRDYSSMFWPEFAFMRLLKERGFLKSLPLQTKLIGSVLVSPNEGYPKRTIDEVRSESARGFLCRLKEYKSAKRAMYDIEVKYMPYFCNYFVAIEQAYDRLSSALSDSFEGYIVVVNNTSRKMVVPVAEAVMDTWKL